MRPQRILVDVQETLRGLGAATRGIPIEVISAASMYRVGCQPTICGQRPNGCAVARIHWASRPRSRC